MRAVSGMSTPQRTALASVIAATVLVALKLVTGLLTGSLGLLAEAAHSATDFVAALLTFLALGVAGRPADREHQYGHGKAEHLSALAEGAVLVLVSAAIGVQAVLALADADGHDVDAIGWAIGVLAVVIVIDLTRMTISLRAARAHGSPALQANALHFGSDLLGTAAVLVGLLFTRAGHPEADAIAALVVAVLVVAAAARLMRRNVEVLMDRAPAAAEREARVAVERAAPASELRRLRLREAAGRYFVDVVLGVRADASAAQGHATADRVEAELRASLPGSDVVVHVEPREGIDLRERATGAALTVSGVREIHNVRVVSVEGRSELSLHLKLPAGRTLEEAHVVADAVERAIAAAVPSIARVHVHLEPLAEPEQAVRADDGAEHRAAAAVVRRVTGSDPVSVQCHREERGVVVFLTVALPGDQSLTDAHETAGEIERELRAERPAVAEVVVHTEPIHDSW